MLSFPSGECRSLTVKERALAEESERRWDDLNAILEAFLPADLQHVCRKLIVEIVSTAYGQCFEVERLLYGALVAALPAQLAEIRAAYEASAIAGLDVDWPAYEAGSPPTLRLIRCP